MLYFKREYKSKVNFENLELTTTTNYESSHARLMVNYSNELLTLIHRTGIGQRFTMFNSVKHPLCRLKSREHLNNTCFVNFELYQKKIQNCIPKIFHFRSKTVKDTQTYNNK